MIKKSWNLIGEEAHWPHVTKRGSLKCHLLLMIISVQKFKDITRFFPQILVIKKSYNHIAQEAKLATAKQR